MSNGRASTSAILVGKVADWLNATALTGADLETIVRGCCNRLAAAGLPLIRIHLTFSMLHPLYRAMGFTWKSGEGLNVEAYRHTPGGLESADRFKRSPYFVLFRDDVEHLRRRIIADAPSEFPIFDDLKKLGVTDYMAFRRNFGDSEDQGMLGSWATDREDGFSEDDIAALLRIQEGLAVTTKMATLSTLAENMLTTYLGKDAGKRVLSGQIKRGDGETVRAAVVMGDMRNSTQIADKLGRQLFIETLNQFFDACAGPFEEAGGQIMSYIGDGFLAAFPTERHKEHSEVACKTALEAARVAVSRMAALNLKRKSLKLDPVGFGLGLHIGNAMFGNVGLRDRLTFSVFGAAVNEVTRLEALTKKYAVPVVASDAFANYCGGEWKTLGREQLRGVGEAMQVKTPANLEVTGEIAHSLLDQLDQYLSDAEQVVMLHRDAKKPPAPALAGARS